MSIKRYTVRLPTWVIPKALFPATSTEAGTANLVSTFRKKAATLTTANFAALYEANAETQHKFIAISGTGPLSIGGFNNTPGAADPGIVVCCFQPGLTTKPEFVKFDDPNVICGNANTALSTDNAAIIAMRTAINTSVAAAVAKAKESFALPTEVTSAAVGSSLSGLPTPAKVKDEVPLALPSLPDITSSLLTPHMAEASRAALRDWKKAHSVEAGEATPRTLESAGYSHFLLSQTVTVNGLAVKETVIELPLFVNTVTGQLTWTSPTSALPSADMLAYERALALELDLAYRERRDAVAPPYPASLDTVTDEDDVRKVGQWKDGTEQLVENFNSRREGVFDKAYKAAVAGGFTGTAAQWAAAKTPINPAAKIATAENSTWWKTALNTIGSGLSSVWDTVTDWGPTGLVTTYAGVTAVDEAKKRDWLIPAAVIAGAIILLK